MQNIIIHTVFLSPRPGITLDYVSKMMEQLRAIGNKVTGFRGIQLSENRTAEKNLAHGFHYRFKMKFESEEARNNYLNHPEHIEIAPHIVENLEGETAGVMVFDYFSQTKSPLLSAEDAANNLVRALHSGHIPRDTLGNSITFFTQLVTKLTEEAQNSASSKQQREDDMPTPPSTPRNGSSE